MAAKFEVISESIRKLLAPKGLLVSDPFPVQRYNADPDCKAFLLPTFGRPTSTLALLVYNNKTLWDPFTSYLAQDPETRLEGTLNPLDDYAAISVNDATQKALAGGSVQYEVRYPHDTGDRFVHFQKLCALAGVAYRNPHCFLCVHPVYGPWMALRAVIVIDQDGPSLTEPWHEVPNPCPQTNSEVVEMCARLREQVNAEDGPIAEALHKRTKQLIEIRDATGRYLESVEQYRYGSLQLNYHYTKDKRFLRDALQLRK